MIDYIYIYIYIYICPHTSHSFDNLMGNIACLMIKYTQNTFQGFDFCGGTLCNQNGYH